MSTAEEKVSRFILVAGLDSSPYAETVLANATANIRGKPGGELHLVHSLDWGGDASVSPLMDQAREYLSRLGSKARETCDARVTTHLGLGTPWRELVQTATSVHADLIIVGTHGRRGAARVLLGSQAELVVRRAPCPVLVVRPKTIVRETEAEPEIEPACPACLEVQERTHGVTLWCARHSSHHPHPHVHYEFPEPYGRGTMLVVPED